MKILYRCKICKQENMVDTIDANDATASEPPKEWIDRLFAALTCNPCYNLRMKFKSAEETIFRTCGSLIRGQQLNFDESEMSALKNKVRNNLIDATQRYAQAVATYRNLAGHVWDIAFVDMLLDRPDKAAVVCREFRRGLRNIQSQVLTPQ